MIAVLVLSLLAALATTTLYVTLIYSVDRYEREPTLLLAAAFVWGAVPSIAAALLINTGLSIPFYLVGDGVGDFVSAAILAPIVEESLKGFAILAIFFLRRQELDSYLDGMIYGAMIGMGFSMVENVFYFMSVFAEEGMGAWGVTILIRAGLFGLNHALFSSLVGLGIAAARLSRSPTGRWWLAIGGWMVGALLHAAHNTGAFLGGPYFWLIVLNDLGGLALTAIIITWALWQEGQWIRKYLAEEVAHGLITEEQYRLAMSLWGRVRHDLALLIRGGMRDYWRGVQYYEKCAELAYKKHHFQLHGDSADLERIARLRQNVAELGQKLVV